MIPDQVELRRSDFGEDYSWGAYDDPGQLTNYELAFDVLAAGSAMAQDVPVLIVNEPIYISDGENSHIRYNAWYPRWAYDQYRFLLSEVAAEQGWHYLDLWDSIPPPNFTDSPVHLTPGGIQELTGQIMPSILEMAG